MQSQTLLKALECSAYNYIEISSNTLKDFDIYLALSGALDSYAGREVSKKINDYFKENKIIKEHIREENNPFWQTEDCHLLILFLWNCCEEITPQGYYFGNAYGDGASIGWWRCAGFDSD